MTWTDADEARRYGATVLEGRTVRLRALEDGDLPHLVRWWRDPAWAALQQRVVRPLPEAGVAETFRRWSTGDDGGVGFSVAELRTGELVGHATLFGATLPERAATLAIIIGGEHVGHGYGTDAVRTLTSYGFREMGLNRIELRVHAFNGPARAVYRKVGFREEGVRREATFHDGRFHDEVIMSILAREWSPGGDDRVAPAGS